MENHLPQSRFNGDLFPHNNPNTSSVILYFVKACGTVKKRAGREPEERSSSIISFL
jgi:hypothetical protein